MIEMCNFSNFNLSNFCPGVVLGLVGTNGIGKSTALKVLAGKQKPNLGRFNDPPGQSILIRLLRSIENRNFLVIVERSMFLENRSIH